MSESTGTASRAALPLPDDLNAFQRRGASCAWCKKVVTALTAVDLGEQSDEDGTVLFPRGCKKCTEPRAMRALLDHTGSCEQCVDDHTGCETGLSLVRLIREARR
jgi:hypothetical protein